MIKRIHLFVIKSFIGPLIMTFFIAEFVLIMQFLWRHIDELVGKGLGWEIITELFLSIAAGLVNTALPLAILIASVMTFGNLGEYFELSAMKSAGISLQRIMFPLILFSFMLGIGSFYWANNVVPYTNFKAGALIYDVGKMRPELNIIPGIFYSDIDNYNIKIGSKNQKTAMMYNCMIYDHSKKKGNIKLILADSAIMKLTDNQKYMMLTLYNGRTYEDMDENDLNNKTYPEKHEVFDKQTIIFELKGFGFEKTDNAFFKRNYQTKTFPELVETIDSLEIAYLLRKQKFIKGFNFLKFNKQNVPTSETQQIPISNNILLSDSLANRNNEFFLNIEKYIDLADPVEKDVILNNALIKAKETRQNIESNKSDIDERLKNIYRHQTAMHQKITLSFACLLFFFIGAPLGAIIRKGGFGLPIIASIVCFIVYYIISMIGRRFVEEGVLPSWLGIWLSSFLILPVGVFLTHKASNDSNLFDMNRYIDVLKKPFRKLNIN